MSLLINKYEQGYAAFLYGMLKGDCPYEPNTTDYTEWQRGWQYAAKKRYTDACSNEPTTWNYGGLPITGEIAIVDDEEMINDLANKLIDLIEAFKCTQPRHDTEARRYAITITELEKALAYFSYYIGI